MNLSLSYLCDLQDASVDPKRVPALPSGYPVHEAAPQDPPALDDGDAGHGHAATPVLRLTHRNP